MGTRDDGSGLAARVTRLLREHDLYTEIACTTCHGQGRYSRQHVNAPPEGEMVDPCNRCYGVGRLWFESDEGFESAWSRCAVLDAQQLIARHGERIS
jgi:DnaJ-class molecular chaperone